MFDIQVFGVSAVGAIVAVCALLKEVGFPQKYSPIVAVVLGVLTGVFLVDPGQFQQGIVTGLSLGLSAVGIHSGVKNVKEGILNLFPAKPAPQDQSTQHQQPQQ